VPNTHRLDARERDLGGGLGRADEVRQARAARAFRCDERARNRSQSSVERELAERGVPLERLQRELVGGGEHGQRDRHVEARSLLAQAGGREVHGDAPLRRPLELGGRDARADALLRLLARTVGEADDRERRQALLEVRFYFDPAGVDADERVGDRACEHVARLGGRSTRVCAGFVPKQLRRLTATTTPRSVRASQSSHEAAHPRAASSRCTSSDREVRE
jgi:hypothetical protein